MRAPRPGTRIRPNKNKEQAEAQRISEEKQAELSKVEEVQPEPVAVEEPPVEEVKDSWELSSEEEGRWLNFLMIFYWNKFYYYYFMY